ncbi:hypothetical protein BO85DRAFT_507857 [Aspergillus piperis CBS 112811]|uniref:Uncharacterized protein n=1 Tax=Aspergillus piperis CBS 112811 TaxID=1448313 RepID=A0A8G1VIX0_9EURO|nr:hypothetical protein BO85DRAFT_507857 [Aspergillus piperis CBS 112811]RAH52148.1 hypothetical protein BO85DRAFT_507857 [Aspergillus piperis CBS 112811]
MTTQTQERFSAATKADYFPVQPSAIYHEPTDDVLTVDGICHTPRPHCLAELKRVLAQHATSPSTPSMRIWVYMARAILGEPVEQEEDVLAPEDGADNAIANSFGWFIPENATEVMTGDDHPLLSLPAAVCAPLWSIRSAGIFHPEWMQEALGIIISRASGTSFDPCVAITRSIDPESRLNQVSAMTGLGKLRVSNLSTGGLSGLFYLALTSPEAMTEEARAVTAFYHGLPYADELSVCDQGGQWAHLPNLAGPLLAAEKLLSGPRPEIFDRVLFSYHCCTMDPKTPPFSSNYSISTLFLARLYDSTLPSFLDCIKALDPISIFGARATAWGTVFSNDIFDYVNDQKSGRALNFCWAVGTWDGPIICARMFRGCLLANARIAREAPGPLFAILFMEFVYLYSARYCYWAISQKCDTDIPLDDTYIPCTFDEIPSPDTPPVGGFRAALRAAFAESPPDGCNGHSEVPDITANKSGQSLSPWQGLAATKCDWDNPHKNFDNLAMGATYEILACLDRGVYKSSRGLYNAHLAWMIRQYDILVECGRDNLAVGRYYVSHRLK